MTGWFVFIHLASVLSNIKHSLPTSELSRPLLALTCYKDWLEFLHGDFLLVAIFIRDGSCLVLTQEECCMLQTS